MPDDSGTVVSGGMVDGAVDSDVGDAVASTVVAVVFDVVVVAEGVGTAVVVVDADVLARVVATSAVGD